MRSPRTGILGLQAGEDVNISVDLHVVGIPALADEGEGYVYMSAAPVYGRKLDVSPDGQVAGLFAGVGGQAIVLYSLTHELQLGGALHANYFRPLLGGWRGTPRERPWCGRLNPRIARPGGRT